MHNGRRSLRLGLHPCQCLTTTIASVPATGVTCAHLELVAHKIGIAVASAKILMLALAALSYTCMSIRAGGRWRWRGVLRQDQLDRPAAILCFIP